MAFKAISLASTLPSMQIYKSAAKELPFKQKYLHRRSGKNFLSESTLQSTFLIKIGMII